VIFIKYDIITIFSQLTDKKSLNAQKCSDLSFWLMQLADVNNNKARVNKGPNFLEFPYLVLVKYIRPEKILDSTTFKDGRHSG